MATTQAINLSIYPFIYLSIHLFIYVYIIAVSVLALRRRFVNLPTSGNVSLSDSLIYFIQNIRVHIILIYYVQFVSATRAQRAQSPAPIGSLLDRIATAPTCATTNCHNKHTHTLIHILHSYNSV